MGTTGVPANMLKAIFIAATVSVALAQWGGGGGNWLGDYVIDTLHGFKLENEDLLHYTSEKLYHQIRDGVGLVPLTDEQEAAYNSPIERWECRRKEAWKVENFRPPRPPPTTQPPSSN